MLYKTSANIIDSLKADATLRDALIEGLSEKDSDTVSIVPGRTIRGESYAQISLTLCNEETVYVHLGHGNYFDIDVDSKGFYLRHIIAIVKACVSGSVKEELAERRGRTIRSKIRLKIGSNYERFYYRSGLFAFGGKKRIINYSGYPSLEPGKL